MVQWVEKREEAQERRGGRAMETSKEEKGEKKRDREEGGEDTPHRAEQGVRNVLALSAAPTGSQTHCRQAASLMELGQAPWKLCHPVPPFFPPRVTFQQTLRNLGSVGQETLRALG